MAQFQFTHLHPVGQRTLRNVAQCLSAGTATFYLGSGIDQQLAMDAGNVSTEATWENLLIELEPFAPADPEDISPYARDWPTETALAARMRLGEERFKSRIASCADVSLELNLKKPFTNALGPLLLKSNLIVTSNYSSHILKLLRAAIKKAKSRQEVIVVTREDLASFEFPGPEPEPDRIFLVYIHGRCVGTGNLVFDAWGYNVAVNDDPHYHRFLYDLFSRRTVVCLGTSLQDIPLRNQAALVFRTRTYQRPSHVSLTYRSRYTTQPAYQKDLKSDSLSRKWANAMHAGYGIRVIPLDQPNLVGTISNLSQPNSLLTQRPHGQDLSSLAAFFDSCGDYESPILQQWLLEAPASRGAQSSRQPSEHIRLVVKRLYKQLLSSVEEDANWEVVARLESHLRHFHYLYTCRFEPNDRSNTQLWEKLAAKLTKAIWNRIGSRLRFSFLTGQFELGPLGLKKPGNVERLRTDDPLYDERLSLSEKIWSPRPLSEDNARETALKLLDVGWESMASKLFLDAAIHKARTAPVANAKTSKEIVELARRGGEIARATGYFRREAKAETLTAMWFEDPEESRIRILSKLRAAETDPTAYTNRRLQRRMVIEPALVAGLTAALLASHIRSLRLSGNDELDSELTKSINPLLEEAGLVWSNVPKQFLDYWDKLIEPRAANSRVFSKALKGDYIQA